jgi:hypothetical protein
MKKIYTMLALLLVLSMTACTAAVHTTIVVHMTHQQGDFKYIVDNGYARITEVLGIHETLVIPDFLGDKPVVSINDGIPFRFGNMTLVASMFPDLAGITIPASMKELPEGVFFDSQLTSIMLGEGNQVYEIINGVLFDKTQKMLHTYPAGRTELSYHIPEGTVKIGHHAFYNCDFLTDVSIPKSVTAIDDEAFINCYQLTFYVSEGSYAQQYAADKALKYTVGEAPKMIVDQVSLSQTAVALTATPVVINTPTAKPTNTPVPDTTLGSVPFPATGTILISSEAGKDSPLTVINKTSLAFEIKLSVNSFQIKSDFTGSENEEQAIAFFIQPGDTAKVFVPQGEYELTYFAGTTWYGVDKAFGNDTIYYRDYNKMLFEQDYGHTLELSTDTDQNWIIKLDY